MNFDLSDDHRLIQQTVRDFARAEVAPVAADLDRTKKFPYDIVRKLGDLGLMGIPFPEEYGGGGGGSLAYALAGEEQGEPYRKMGWNASDTRPLTFTDCRVPEENLLGPRGAGFKQFLHILDIGRIGVAAMGVGLAQGALDEALKYAKERRAFGQPISRFQAIQAKLADLSTEIAAARLLVYKAAYEKDQARNFTLTAAQA